MAELSTDARNKLPATDFVFPKTRDYPIHDLEHARKALQLSGGKPENARVKAVVYQRYPQLRKAEGEPQTVALDVELWKSDSDHMVYGVVLTPDVEDSQGDIASAEEIAKAAHRWLAEYREHDVQHSGVAKADIVPVESFIAPADFEIGGHQVRKGAWVLGASVGDSEWKRVEKGELTGWSITGSAIREAIAA